MNLLLPTKYFSIFYFVQTIAELITESGGSLLKSDCSHYDAAVSVINATMIQIKFVCTKSVGVVYNHLFTLRLAIQCSSGNSRPSTLL